MSFIDPRDIAFWLYDWLRADALTGHPAYEDHSRETFDAVLELAERLAADRFATHYKKSDRIEPSLENGVVRVIPEVKQALKDYAEAGLFAASFAPAPAKAAGAAGPGGLPVPRSGSVCRLVDPGRRRRAGDQRERADGRSEPAQVSATVTNWPFCNAEPD